MEIRIPAEQGLQGKPTPHFAVGDMTFNQNYNEGHAIIVFPSTKSSIRERGHVNLMHHIAGIWNVSHVMADLRGLEQTRAKSGNFEIFAETKPDQEISLYLKIIRESRKMGLASGEILALYSLGPQNLARFEITYGARLKNYLAVVKEGL